VGHGRGEVEEGEEEVEEGEVVEGEEVVVGVEYSEKAREGELE